MRRAYKVLEFCWNWISVAMILFSHTENVFKRRIQFWSVSVCSLSMLKSSSYFEYESKAKNRSPHRMERSHRRRRRRRSRQQNNILRRTRLFSMCLWFRPNKKVCLKYLGFDELRLFISTASTENCLWLLSPTEQSEMIFVYIHNALFHSHISLRCHDSTADLSVGYTITAFFARNYVKRNEKRLLSQPLNEKYIV